MAKEVRFGDVGTVVVATITDDGVPLDISTASAMAMFFTKPSGVVIERTAGLYSDGSDGKIKYVSTAADWDEVGKWDFQAYLTIGTYRLKSKISTFYVERVLK